MSPRAASSAPMTLVRVDPTSATPLHRQLYNDLRTAIVAGRLARGHQLPAARVLAHELSISRQTVLLALDQLRAEGYVETRERSGTFVSHAFPDEYLAVDRREPEGALPPSRGGARTSRTSTRKKRYAHTAVTCPTPTDACQTSSGHPRPFRVSLPALDEFPWDIWARLMGRHLRHAGHRFADHHTAFGYQPLRVEIAAYVSAARGVVCTSDQVVITNGSRQALDLAARVLVKPNGKVWIEDPCYLGARDALLAAGARLVPVPIDADGICVSQGIRRAADACAAYVTPSHQYPLGVTMTAPRRVELLQWAHTSGAWIIEDDYDSEFRYASRPLAALQGLDTAERVIYIGTFSKTLFPSLRIGYLIVPPTLLDAVAEARAGTERFGPSYEGPLTDFIADGHFARHLRRMRLLYQERRDALIQAVREIAPPGLVLGTSDAGMHVVGWLPDGVSDRELATHTAMAGLETLPVSHYTLRHPQPDGLVLGFAGFTPRVLRDAVQRLAMAIEQYSRQRRRP